MDLNHRFHVPSDIDETWAHFQDVAGLAGCFPGAQVTSVEGDDFTGSCKVKLGPIALVYNGTGVFVERDEPAHRLKVEAKGKDKRGNGTAAAKATLTMSPASSGGTDVEVVTDLAITGKPAQFGRGLMQDVSDKLLGQFVACLEQQLTPVPDEPVPEPSPGPSSDGAAAGPDGTGGTAPAAASASAGSASSAGAGSAAPSPRPVRPAPKSDDALDLGATVLPILIKSYWKQAAIGLGVLALIVRLLKR